MLGVSAGLWEGTHLIPMLSVASQGQRLRPQLGPSRTPLLVVSRIAAQRPCGRNHAEGQCELGAGHPAAARVFQSKKVADKDVTREQQ